ncbi:hypothetical protein J1N35_018012 [Gossypium stocksii]|uniref:DUF4283 domain-containing protein n=1 Tax=Gossypium stocksii TaxID=47602 RepID=A0A9D3VQ25_9ROSI|nr:hypothetical protein J1N35_018012 [Gossypium stocksii]
MAWIRLPGLSGFLYKRNILEAIGNTIGKVVKYDFKTNNRTRGRFSRLALFINLDKPLIFHICINGEIQRVEYEALLMEISDKDNDKVVVDNGPNRNNVDFGKESEPTYGPWMLVECRSRRRSGDSRGSDGLAAGKGKSRSSFNISNVEGKRASDVDSAGGDIHVAQDNERLRLKSPEEKIMDEGRSNGFMIGPHSKDNPTGVYLQACPNEANLLESSSLSLSRATSLQGCGSVKDHERMSFSTRPTSNCGNLLDPNSSANNLKDIKAHFNPAFEGPVEVEVWLSENVLDNGKYSAVTFKNFSDSHVQSNSRFIEIMSAGNTVIKGRKSNGKFGVTRGGHQNNNVLKERGS